MTLKISQAKNVNIYFSTRNLYILGENTSKYCSRIIVAHVHATGFSKAHPACHNIANGIKPGSGSRKTDKYAVDCSKAVCWGVVIYARCINCSYNNVAKGIRLLDKKAF